MGVSWNLVSEAQSFFLSKVGLREQKIAYLPSYKDNTQNSNKDRNVNSHNMRNYAVSMQKTGHRGEAD